MKTITLKTSHLLIIVSVLVVAIGLGSYFIFFRKPASETITNGQPPLGGMSLVVDENMKDYTGKNPEDRGGAITGTKIPGYGTVRLPSGTTDVKMILLNPEGNQCYFTFELVVDGEAYFTSNLVEPSKCIEDLALTKPLDRGEYTAMLKISCYSLDESLTPMNGANVEFELIVI
jgi:hypothetical protein